MTNMRLRILIGKIGLDGHDRGVKIIVRALRDAGMEVIYTGLHQTPQMIARAALEEGVDAVGVSILSGAHMTLFPELMDLLKQQGSDHVSVFGGGIIPNHDIEELKKIGVKTIFLPGTSMEEIVAWVNKNVKPRFVERG